MSRVLTYACILLTATALPVAVVEKKDPRLCCKCIMEGNDGFGKTVTNLGSGLISTVNILPQSLAGCGGSTATMISSVGLPIPPVQIGVPQVQFPAPVNIIPQQQQYQLYNVLPLQSSFFGIQQPKITTQCCTPCPDGNGLCCCTPSATTTRPYSSHSLHSSYHPAGADLSLRSASILISTIIPLILDYIV